MKNVIVKHSDRFKSVFVSVNLLLPLKGDEAGKNALLAMVLKKSNKMCATEKELNIKLAGLYNTSLEIDVEKIDNLYNIQFSMEMLNIKYMSEEKVREAKDLLIAAICMPDIQIGKFNEEVFNREKDTIIEKIKEERDEKRKYAVKCLEKDMFKDTDYGVSVLGDEEQIKNITNEELVKHYEYVISNAEIVVTVVGNLEGMAEFPQKIYEELTGKCGKHMVKNIQVVEKYENTIQEREENQEIAQSILCIGLKLKDGNKEDMYKMAIYNALLGGTPASKMFQNVREKASLAYFAKSMYNRHKKAIYMFAGIDPNNNLPAKDIMLQQVEALRQGEISEIEFNAAKHSIISAYVEIQDSKSGIAKNALNNEIYFGHQVEIEKMIEEFNKICVEDVIDLAQKIYVTNIFLLGGVANV